VSAPEPYYDDGQVRLYVGDCLDVLAGIADDSVDAVCTDPPYGLEFMGREWDAPWRSGINADAGFSVPGFSDGSHRLPRPTFTGSTNPACANCSGRQRGRRDGTAIWKTCTCDYPAFPNVRATEMQAFQAWCETWTAECLRVLKPGGHMLAFGGTRTWHRLACAIEDAGFEIRDSISWLYGSGFPKSLDVSKAIDKAAGAEREITGDGQPFGRGSLRNRSRVEMGYRPTELNPDGGSAAITAPATEDAARWSGWGTALKPAWEPIVVARKPLAGTVARNVLAHGTGALNVDGCRVDGGMRPARSNAASASGLTGTGGADTYGSFAVRGSIATGETSEGRWPPNVLLTHSAACDVRDQGGGEIRSEGACAPDCPVAELDRQSGVLTSGANPARRGTDKFRDAYGEFAGQPECTVYRGADAGGASRFFPAFRYEAKAPASERPRLEDGTAHPTVKPLELMRWLVRLVTPPGGTVADFFAGSGTTGEACVIEGFNCILAEKDPASAELIKARLSKPIQPVMFGLEAS
jgi:DNA modification methylase